MVVLACTGFAQCSHWRLGRYCSVVLLDRRFFLFDDVLVILSDIMPGMRLVMLGGCFELTLMYMV